MLGRNDGDLGWQTIRRGYAPLLLMARGADAMRLASGQDSGRRLIFQPYRTARMRATTFPQNPIQRECQLDLE